MRVLAACHKQLLWVIANKRCEYRVASVHGTVTGGELDTINPSGLQRLEDPPHTGMEKIRHSTSTCSLIRYVLQSGGREVAEEYLTVARGLSTDSLWKVTDRQIDWIC